MVSLSEDGRGEDGQVIGEEEWASLYLGGGGALPPILIKGQFKSYMQKE